MNAPKEIQDLKNGILNLQAQLDIMTKTLNSLELKLREREASPQSTPRILDGFQASEFHEPTGIISLQSQQRMSQAPVNFSSESNPSISYGNSFQRRTSLKKIQQQPSQPSTSAVLSEFNKLASLNGYEAKLARNNFISKYKVRTFNCVNHDARMNEPIPPPEFVEVEAGGGGDYWAIPLKDNLFVVLPDIKTYTDNYHKARAVGEVFKSNFVKGNTYNKITVEKPAIFEFTGSAWILNKQGVLRLG